MVSKNVIGVLLVACAASVLLLSACSAGGGSAETKSDDSSNATAALSRAGAYHKIDAEEAKEMIDGGEVTVVDVRTPEEYAEKHLPDALNIPNEAIGSERPEQLADLDEALIVYCRTGVRSKQASDKLIELGYTSVYDMGGIVDWPYDTVDEKGDA